MSTIRKRVIVAGSETVPRADTATVVALADGTLVMVYNRYAEGEKEGEDLGRSRIYREFSEDGGRTWTGGEVILDVPPGDMNVMNPGLCRLDDGTLLLTAMRVHSRGCTSGVLYASEDGGETFREREPIWEEITTLRSPGGGGAANLYRLSTERILLPVGGGDTDDEFPLDSQSIGCYWSDDGGDSWDAPAEWLSLPMRGAMEPSVAQLPDGELVMSIRTQLGSVFVSRSHDHGETWSPPQATGPRAPESCTCLRCHPQTGDLVLFWNPTRYDPDHHHYGNRNHLAAAVSADRGRSWSRPRYIERSRRTNHTNIGCTFTDEGAALVTYMSADIGPDAYGEDWSREAIDLELARVPEDWFYATDAR